MVTTKKKKVVRKAVTRKTTAKNVGRKTAKKVGRKTKLYLNGSPYDVADNYMDYDVSVYLTYHIGHKTPNGVKIDMRMTKYETNQVAVKRLVDEFNNEGKYPYKVSVVYVAECIDIEENTKLNDDEEYTPVCFTSLTKIAILRAIKRYFGANVKIYDFVKKKPFILNVAKKNVTKRMATTKRNSVKKPLGKCGIGATTDIYDYDAVMIINYHVGHKTAKGFKIDYDIDVDETDLEMVKEKVKRLNKYKDTTYIVAYTAECYKPNKKNVRWFEQGYDEVFDATTKSGAIAAVKKHYGSRAKIWDYNKKGDWK